MAILERLRLYRKIEEIRQRPLVVYATSSRPNAAGNMAADVIPQLLDQINTVPSGNDAIDILVVSQGGDPSVAWRTICLLRERFKKVGVLVPSSAFSAATLLCLGADEIVMHRYGNLGPVDPQVTVRRTKQNNEQVETKYGYEEVVSFIQFIRERAHVTDQLALTSIISKMLDDTGTVSIGTAVRGSMLSQTLGENLLRMHMKEDGEAAKAKDIAEILNKKFYHHGHALGRTEAKTIGLKVVDCPAPLDDIIWKVWEELETEMKMREAFNPMVELMQNPAAAPLFAPITFFSVPQGIPPAIMQQVMQQITSQLQIAIHSVPPTDCSLIGAVVESRRMCRQFVVQRKIFGSRQPDAQIQVTMADVAQRWQSFDLPHDPDNEEKSSELPNSLVDDIVIRKAGVDTPLAFGETKSKPVAKRARKAAGNQ